jgi:hypothetical protein
MVISIFSARQPAPDARQTPEQIRHRLYEALADCKDMSTQRAIYKINVAATPADLWLLRCDLHQCIARVHNQGEANKRINNLLDAFEGWVPARQLAEIKDRADSYG